MHGTTCENVPVACMDSILTTILQLTMYLGVGSMLGRSSCLQNDVTTNESGRSIEGFYSKSD